MNRMVNHPALASRGSQEDDNFYQFYLALLSEEETPAAIDSYAPLGSWLDTAMELHRARRTAGIAGLKAYVRGFANLKEKTEKDRRLIEVLSGALPYSERTNLNGSGKPVGILLSEVAPTKIKWLWKPRIALGKVTMLDSDPGLGKSILALDLAARISKGGAMPDGEPGVEGGVVLITLEDGLEDTIQPRLARAGADLRRILFIGTIETTDPATGYTYPRPFSLPEDLPYLEAAIERVAAKLVIVDPVMAILGGKDTYKDNETRRVLFPLQMLAERAGAAVILVRHLTKQGGENALYRGGGSIAFIGVARTGLMVARDPLDESKCILAHIKSNIGKLAPSLSYHIANDEEQGDERAYVVWEGTSARTIRELMALSTQKPGSGRQEILRILKESYPAAMAPAEIGARVDMTEENLLMTLGRMVKDGQIEKVARGSYAARAG